MTDMTALVRRSWAQAISNKQTLGLLFYTKLFQIAPETETLFASDFTSQAKKLVSTLAFIVDNLDEEETVLKAAEDLAVRHVDYNVTPEHYTVVGTALIETLRELLGSAFDPATEAAWSETYEALSAHMISTAYS